MRIFLLGIFFISIYPGEQTQQEQQSTFFSKNLEKC